MSLIQFAAEALRRDQAGAQAIQESTLDDLARIPSQALPGVSTPAWQVCARYRGADDSYRIVSYRVAAGNAERAGRKAAAGNWFGDTRQWEPFPESDIISVEPTNALAEFAHLAAQLVDSSRQSTGVYEVNPTLLKQSRVLAILVCQQLV